MSSLWASMPSICWLLLCAPCADVMTLRCIACFDTAGLGAQMGWLSSVLRLPPACCMLEPCRGLGFRPSS